MANHPTEFYIIDIFYKGAWEHLTTEPATKSESLDLVSNFFGSDRADMDAIYVLHVREDGTARDLTEDWCDWHNAMLDDDVDHESQERHGWEQV